MNDPFQLLKETEQKCRAKAEALPSIDSVKDDWIGIGFRIGDTELLVKMAEVAEILDTPDFTRVPGVKAWVVGIANVRGSLLPLMDLKGFITGEVLQNRKAGRVLVVKYNGMNTGLIVDEVLGMRHFSLNEQVAQSVDVEKELKPFIKQSFQRDNQYWPVFSFYTLVEDEQFIHAAIS